MNICFTFCNINCLHVVNRPVKSPIVKQETGIQLSFKLADKLQKCSEASTFLWKRLYYFFQGSTCLLVLSVLPFTCSHCLQLWYQCEEASSTGCASLQAAGKEFSPWRWSLLSSMPCWCVRSVCSSCCVFGVISVQGGLSSRMSVCSACWFF